MPSQGRAGVPVALNIPCTVAVFTYIYAFAFEQKHEVCYYASTGRFLLSASLI